VFLHDSPRNVTQGVASIKQYKRIPSANFGATIHFSDSATDWLQIFKKHKSCKDPEFHTTHPPGIVLRHIDSQYQIV
jgi:hypothetical protein